MAATAVSVTDANGDLQTVAVGAPDYETVAASQTDQTLGPTGGTGDYLRGPVSYTHLRAHET